MSRPVRAFTAEPFGLEGRSLLAVGPAATPTNPPTVQFVGDVFVPTTVYANPAPIQVVTQQAGEATVTLSRSDTAGSLRVEVTTDQSSPFVGVNVGAVDQTATFAGGQSQATLIVPILAGAPNPSSPFVGVNVGAVDQTVTFADGQSQATLTVPILAGAPNPGEVDVNLHVNPIDRATIAPDYLDLRVVASDPTAPPKVVSLVYESNKILLTFNKAMNPVGASNVKNYVVKSVAEEATGFLGQHTSFKRKAVPLQSAQYDPASQSVTLILKQPVLDDFRVPVLYHGRRAGASIRARQQSNVSQGLTDLQGNPINADTTSGRVGIQVHLI